MTQRTSVPSGPPSALVSSLSEERPSLSLEASLPTRAFGYGTQHYWIFVEALMAGLRAYEALQKGGQRASAPLPTA